MGSRHAVMLVATCALLVAALLLAAASAQALVVPLTTKQLCDHSQTIVVATVGSTQAARTTAATAPLVGPCTIETGVRLRVLEVLKGTASPELTIHVPGGRLGETTTVVGDPVSFARGRSYVVFLDALGRVIGAWQGNPALRAGRVAGTGLTLTAFERQLAGLTGEAPRELRPQALDALRRAVPMARPQAAASPARGKAPVPVVKSITPRTGSAGTDARVTITGKGFGGKKSGAARVQFYYGKRSGAPDDSARISAPIVSWSAGRIVCKVPAAQIENYRASAGSGPLTVRNMWGRESKGVAFSVSFGYWGARWKPAQCTYHIDLPGERPELRSGVVAAMDAWNGAGAAFTFLIENDSSSSRPARAGATPNRIDWGPLAAGVIAQSSADYTGKLFAKDAVYTRNAIRLNSNEAWGDGQSGTYDVESIALHELGHALGLRDLYGHADSDKAMYGWGYGRSSSTVPLSDDDVAGIQWIYGKKSAVGDPFPICSAAGDQQDPRISGNTVVWVDGRNGNPDIYGYDLAGQREFPICTAPGEQSLIDISGSIVVWTDYRDGEEDLPWGPSGDIYGYDLVAQRELLICDATGDQSSPTISGDTVVWSDMRWDDFDLYGSRLSSGDEFYIPTSGWARDQQLSGTRLLYTDAVDDLVDPYITVYDLASEDSYVIGWDAFNPLCFALDGSLAVWWDMRDEGWGVYGYDLASDREFPIKVGGGRTWTVDVSGQIVVWDDWPSLQSPEGNILGYNAATRSSIPVCTASGPQGGPSVSGDTVVWMDKRKGNWDIYGRVLSQ